MRLEIGAIDALEFDAVVMQRHAAVIADGVRRLREGARGCLQKEAGSCWARRRQNRKPANRATVLLIPARRVFPSARSSPASTVSTSTGTTPSNGFPDPLRPSDGTRCDRNAPE